MNFIPASMTLFISISGEDSILNSFSASLILEFILSLVKIKSSSFIFPSIRRSNNLFFLSDNSVNIPLNFLSSFIT
ncbi:TPA: hypothetical protein DIC38_02180 [Candidatus Nomurabacteria bacterium]|nr:hypothetical protein [Candidatus Nomurabacteria bacterium]